jgi:lysine 2,3-aminomutase
MTTESAPRRLALLSDAPQSSRSLRTWRDQARHAVTSLATLEAALPLTASEREGTRRAIEAGLPLSITPYYLSLIDPKDPEDPIRRQCVPRVEELEVADGDLRDPLGETAYSPAPNLVQRYPDRALLLVTDRCSVYCRFCTRARMVGQDGGARSEERLRPAIEYLRAHPEVREVILSGGDPLVMSTPRLARILALVRSVPHVDLLRLGTRAPVVLPSRITPSLARTLREFSPLWLMTHFNHPRELTAQARAACERLADHGIPVMNQCVLLRGVNDDAATLEALFRGLVRARDGAPADASVSRARDHGDAARPAVWHRAAQIRGRHAGRTRKGSVVARRDRASRAGPNVAANLARDRGGLSRSPEIPRAAGLDRKVRERA